MKQAVTLHTHSGSIRIKWDDDALSPLLSLFFTPWQVKNDRENAIPSYTVAVTRGHEDYRITSPLTSILSCSTMPEIAMRFEEILTGLALTMLEPSLLIHSAVIDLDGKGALIAADHGMGKTTLTLTALSSGFRALSDEAGIVTDNRGSAAGFPRPFHVSGDVTRLDPPVIPDECRRYGLTDDFSFVFFDRYYEPSTTLSCIVFPNRRPGNTVISDISELEALRRLLPLGFNFYRAPDGRAGDLAQLLKTVRAYTLHYEDHWEAVDGIRELIGRTR